MFTSVLVANRGEIALRAFRTFKRLGLAGIAVYSRADRLALHLQAADEALLLDGDPAQVYHDHSLLVEAALASGAQAVFPGYGFLSEDHLFARACLDAGIAWIGPRPEHLEVFGHKGKTRSLARSLGIPMVTGQCTDTNPETALQMASGMGYPVIIKPARGGGGQGMFACTDAVGLKAALARLEDSPFSPSRQDLVIERFMEGFCHVEVQVFGDGKGGCLVLGDRDCSVQRRHQKLVEESPAPGLPREIRQTLHEAARKIATSTAYASAGTAEFMYRPADRTWYLVEFNPRIQVEHGVTEACLGIDLLEWMCLLAQGKMEKLPPLPQSRGHALELRIYAEKPDQDFRVQTGRIHQVRWPSGIRVETAISKGAVLPVFYDHLLGKLIIHTSRREESLEAGIKALEELEISGIAHNSAFLGRLLDHPEFRNHTLDSQWCERLVRDSQFMAACREPGIEVLEPGTCSTWQDLAGRPGAWARGIPPSGPLDERHFAQGLDLLFPHLDAEEKSRIGGLECTLLGPVLRFNSPCRFVITGPGARPDLDGIMVKPGMVHHAKAGQVLDCGSPVTGMRNYLFTDPPPRLDLFLNSVSTFALGGMGGHMGRALAKGDMLRFAPPPVGSSPGTGKTLPRAHPGTSLTEMQPAPGNCVQDLEWQEEGVVNLRVLEGPHGAPEYLDRQALDDLIGAEWTVHHQSDRSGIRLSGPLPRWKRPHGGNAGLHPSNIHDTAYSLGAVNFTGDRPVILCKDGPSLGGFASPFTIRSEDLWKCGQLRPGQKIRFHNSGLPACLGNLKGRPGVPGLEILRSGDQAVLLEWETPGFSLRTRLLTERLEEGFKTHLGPDSRAEFSPGVRSLLFRHGGMAEESLLDLIRKIHGDLSRDFREARKIRHLRLPICLEDSRTRESIRLYQETIRAQAPWLPDNLEFLRRINGFGSKTELFETLLKARYLVLGLGDVYPGSPCAIALDPRHRLKSSKYNPARTSSPEGGVGFGGSYLCIYSCPSPGGYQLAGRTIPVWFPHQDNPTGKSTPLLLENFDLLSFYPVDEGELENIRQAIQAGRWNLDPEQELLDPDAHETWLKAHEREILEVERLRTEAFMAEHLLQGVNSRHETLAAQAPGHQDPGSLRQDIPAAPGSPGNGDMTSLSGEATGPGLLEIQAPLTAQLGNLACKPGDVVEAGSVVFWLDAMKMRIPVLASSKGMIKKFHASPGEVVQEGKIICTLELPDD